MVHGINRYIVGCKYIYNKLQFGGIFRINRYIVGCKWEEENDKALTESELIDT